MASLFKSPHHLETRVLPYVDALNAYRFLTGMHAYKKFLSIMGLSSTIKATLARQSSITRLVVDPQLWSNIC